MIIISNDEVKVVDIGNTSIWRALYSTIFVCLGSKIKKYNYASSFLKNGKCDGKDGYATAREFNLIRDELSKYPPSKMVYNLENKNEQPPWGNKISPVITSCSNYFTTADGKDLLFEIVSILCYAQVKGVNLEIRA